MAIAVDGLKAKYGSEVVDWGVFRQKADVPLSTRLDHFAMKAQWYQAALVNAFEQLQTLKANCSLA